MFHLTRKDFPDLPWSPDDLDDVAQLWLIWHERARGSNPRRLQAYHSVRMRLWGFPRSRGDMLADKLEEQLAAARLYRAVSLAEPDYLVVATSFEHASEPCSLGDWLGLVSDPLFDGLVLFLELSVHDWPDEPVGPATAGGTLVLCGQIRDRQLVLKAIWPVGLEPGLENLYKVTVWPGEAGFIEGLDSFRNGVVPVAAENFFVKRAAQRRINWFARTIIHVPGTGSAREGRLSSFLFRTTYHLLSLAVVVLVYLLSPRWRVLTILLLVCVVLDLGLLGYVVGSEVRRVCAFYFRMKAAMKRVYDEPVNYQPATLADYGLEADPNVGKYTAELEGLGCRRLGDIRSPSGKTGKFINRAFVLPNERTYVFMNIMASAGPFKKFPAHVFFLIVTYLEDGRVVTINEGGGYRKSLLATVFTRRFPGIDEPETLLAKHRNFVSEICARGHVLAPLADLPELLGRIQRDHEELRPLMQKRGYFSWSAAIRQNFDLVRKEYLEPAPTVKEKEEADADVRR